MKFDIDGKTFYSYVTYIQQTRKYSKNWAFVMYKVNFGKWVDKDTRDKNIPQEPSKDFLEWLDEYQYSPKKMH
ncbi:hypothetical protein [Moraxella sp. RCAD0137]|uniref:hypothetical protein n=1 Tax=Moraxella sp. RCAD0137 TaxID=1775913 RepID=UPI000C9FEFDB|nr:hypothetical protein [Moraxella sp. RCAD0137]PNP96216.1 hypothetical protein AZ602_09595 [Moraxella sp. RCAD0137]